MMLAEDFARIAAELEGYDIQQFRIEVARYGDIAMRIEAAQDEEELEGLMISVYTAFDIDTEDKIALFTDGITETRNCNNELYGEERLLNIIKEHPDNTAEKVQQDLNDFRGECPISDDLTFVLLKLFK
jgi:serine/threonine protein phosphatase PrpC